MHTDSDHGSLTGHRHITRHHFCNYGCLPTPTATFLWGTVGQPHPTPPHPARRGPIARPAILQILPFRPRRHPHWGASSRVVTSSTARGCSRQKVQDSFRFSAGVARGTFTSRRPPERFGGQLWGAGRCAIGGPRGWGRGGHSGHCRGPRTSMPRCPSGGAGQGGATPHCQFKPAPARTNSSRRPQPPPPTPPVPYIFLAIAWPLTTDTVARASPLNRPPPPPPDLRAAAR